MTKKHGDDAAQLSKAKSQLLEDERRLEVVPERLPKLQAACF